SLFRRRRGVEWRERRRGGSPAARTRWRGLEEAPQRALLWTGALGAHRMAQYRLRFRAAKASQRRESSPRGAEWALRPVRVQLPEEEASAVSPQPIPLWAG